MSLVTGMLGQSIDYDFKEKSSKKVVGAGHRKNNGQEYINSNIRAVMTGFIDGTVNERSYRQKPYIPVTKQDVFTPQKE